MAYAAHGGGFLAGIVLHPLFANPRRVGAKRRGVVVGRSDLDCGGWW